MDLQKEKHNYLAMLVAEDAITQEQCSNLSLHNGGNCFHSDFLASSKVDCINWGWQSWLKAKAQAVPEWISVEDKLPETEPNTDGVVCAVVCSLGNVYRARYMHDVDNGVDTKYWSEFAVNYNGKEYEHYEINAKITHWMPLPEPPTKECK